VLFIEIALQRGSFVFNPGGFLLCLVPRSSRPLLHFQQLIDCAPPVTNRCLQVAPMLVSCSDNFANRNSCSGQFRTDRATEKTLLMKDAYFSHVPRIIPKRYAFAHVRCQRRVHVTLSQKVNSVIAHFSCPVQHSA
jgi:hypothetical protein